VARTGQRLLILATWVLLIIAVEWTFVIRPSADGDEHAGGVFSSMLDVGMPWLFDSIVVLLIAFSLERRRRRRRLWIVGIWLLIVAAVAWIQFQPVLRPPAIDMAWLRERVQGFAYPWLFELLIVLWIALALEKRIADRSLLTLT
jgi:hypothetical protein